MNFGYSPYVVATLFTAAASAVMSAYAWKRHNRAPEAVPLALLMMIITEWLAVYAFSLTSLDEQTKMFWAKLEYIGITATPVALLAYAIYHARRESWLTARRLVIVAFIPATTLLLMWTNEHHGLIWADYSVYREGSIMLTEKTYGAMFWVEASYGYFLLLAASVLILRYPVSPSRTYRWQRVVLGLAILVPWVGNCVYVAGLSPVRNLDLTPFAFAFSGLMLSISLFALRLLDVVPVARQALLTQMRDAVLVVDAQDRVVELNPAAERVVGLRAARVIGRQVGEVLQGQLSPQQTAQAAAGEPLEIVVVESGSGRYYDVSVTILHRKESVPAGRLIVLRDITERRRVQQELEQAYQREARARQEVEAEIERRSDFLRALVHELKTPVTSILVASNLLAEEAPEGPLLDLSKNLERSADNLNRRIDELLDLARGEVGMLRLKLRETNMLELLRDVANDMAPVLSRRGQSLELDVPSSLPAVRADDERVGQVVMNLLSNAVKFTPEGGAIVLKARESGAQLVVEVQDNGPGISPEDRERLFNAYHRVPRDRERFSGLGLGLALSKTLVRLHGGEIWVESEPGRGSTFGFTVPLDAA